MAIEQFSMPKSEFPDREASRFAPDLSPQGGGEVVRRINKLQRWCLAENTVPVSRPALEVGGEPPLHERGVL